ncbi:MAG: type II secretion system protein GspL [Legionellaceae bacterium]
MATCFIFFDASDEDGYLCLRLNDAQELEAPLMRRTIEALHLLQDKAKTLIVAPASFASLLTLDLPWLGEKKAREAIPFALEEQLAEPVSILHFAFDRAHYQEGMYSVVVMSRDLIQTWLDGFKAQGISFDALTLDWFALDKGEALVTDTHLLVYHTDLLGALPPELAQLYLSQEPCSAYFFKDSLASLKQPTWTLEGDSFALFIAQRLATKPILNLCQGDFKNDRHKNARVLPWYYAAGLLFGLFFILFFVMDGLKYYRLSTQEAMLDKKISSIYHVYFPEATSVVNPKMRIEARIKSDAYAQQGSFWSALAVLSSEFREGEISIREISFHDNVFLIALVSHDFSRLEAFEERLRQSHLQVKQIDASTHEKEVYATVELKA